MPGEKPTISIIIAAYNAEGFISHALISLKSQTFPHWEAIIVDDASTDSTHEVVNSFQVDDPRIRYFKRENNGGAGAARKTALLLAKGDWIGVLDADDKFAPERLERLIKFGETNELDIVADNLVLVDPSTNAISRTALPQRNRYYILDLLTFIRNDTPARGFAWGLLKPIIRKRFIDETKLTYQEFRYGEDFTFYFELLFAGARAKIIDSPLYIYTLPISEINFRKSPNSRTPMKTELLLNSSNYLKEKYLYRLSKAEKCALERREKLLKSFPIASEFKILINERQFMKSLLKIISNPVLIVLIWMAISWRAKSYFFSASPRTPK